MTTRSVVFNTGHLIGLASIAALIWALPNMQRMNSEAGLRTEAREPMKAQLRQDREQIRTLQQRSSLAIERLDTGACQPVVDKETQEDIYFSDLVKAEARLTSQSMAPGTMVCNVFGETGIVGNDGQIGSVAIATLEDKEAYLEMYNQLLEIPARKLN